METRKKEESGKWTEERKKCHSCGTCPRESGEQESRKQKSEVGGRKKKMTDEKLVARIKQWER